MKANELRKKIPESVWEKTNTSSFTVADFEELDKLLAKLKKPEDIQDFKEICNLFIKENGKSSTAAQYMYSLIGRHPVDDRFILEVLEKYYDEKKWEEVEFLANKILSFNENGYALRALADYYDHTDNLEKKIHTWERLVQVDFSQTDILLKLADYYEGIEDSQSALIFYRRVVMRYLKLKDFSSLKNIWSKFLDIKGENPDYLIDLANRIAKSCGAEKGIFFLNTLFNYFKDNLDVKITVLRNILRLNSNNQEAIKALIECYKEKYKDNDRLDFCLNNTGILESYYDINTAADKFETEIEFVKGAFVFHKSWGIGRIMKIGLDEMEVTFVTKGKHKMGCNMGFTSLVVLPKSHIWVLKGAIPKDKLKKRIIADVNWALQTLILSKDNCCSIKQMKAELCPDLLTNSEWSNWSTAAKKELMSNPYFGISDNAVDSFTVRKTPITFEEKEFNLFKSEKKFFNKLRIVRDFIARKGNVETEEFGFMISYFETQSKLSTVTPSESMSAFLFLTELQEEKNMKFITLENNFAERYDSIREKFSLFSGIEDTDLKKRYIDKIVETQRDWASILSKLWPYYMSSYIPDTLIDGGKRNTIYKVLKKAAFNYNRDSDFFLHLVKMYSRETWAKASVNEEKLILNQLVLLGNTYVCIENHSEVTLNRKRQKTITTSLFESKYIFNYLEKCDLYSAVRIYSLLSGEEGLESRRIEVKHFISTHFDDAEEIFKGENNKIDRKKIIPSGLLCTQKSYDAKAAELDHIINVEIPENSKEIGTARELGDLRENAEYQYGKDKQKNLNFLMGKLSDEISRAQIVTPDTVDPKYASFGTKVVLKNNLKDTTETFTLFGPWESDPNKDIINFKAPLGKALYNMEVGETRKFVINESSYDYTVISIEKVDF